MISAGARLRIPISHDDDDDYLDLAKLSGSQGTKNAALIQIKFIVTGKPTTHWIGL